MKKAILISALMTTLVLTIPTFAQQSEIWVVMQGRVERWGATPVSGYCGALAKIGEWAEAHAFWTSGKPCIAVIHNFYWARLMNTTLVELNYNGADFYILGLWNVYNVTFIFEPGVEPGNYTLTVVLLIDHGEGTLSVTGGWIDFAIAIKGINEVAGTVKHYSIRSTGPIPIGDTYGPNGIPDNRINIWDLAHVAKAYGSTPGMPGMCYDFSFDFNCDFKIDIYDLTTIAANLGEEY